MYFIEKILLSINLPPRIFLFVTCFQISPPLPHSPFAILLTYDRRLNKYEPFSDTETTALLFPPPAEERYPRIPLHVSYHQDMEIATLI